MDLSRINKLDPMEQAVVKWQYGMYGGFFTSLWKCITTADLSNLDRLEKGFPVEVGGYKKFTNESGWWERVERKLNNEEPKKTPKEWSCQYDISIIDADGWQDKSVKEPITEEEFLKRVSISTIRGKGLNVKRLVG